MRSTDLGGFVAFITGAGPGLGSSAARLMARAGASVFVSDVDGGRAEALAAVIAADGLNATPLACDVSDEGSVSGALGRVWQSAGRLDIVFNNAALLAPTVLSQDQTVATMSLDVWDRVMAVNVRGPMTVCKHAVPMMKTGGGGSIINTSSINGTLADGYLTAYGVSKSAVDGLTRHVATAFGRDGIRCNAVAPSLIDNAHSVLPPSVRAVHAQETLTPFLGTPDDIAEVVVFLASPAARYVTGQVIAVDGGTTAHLPTLWGAIDARTTLAAATTQPAQ